MRINELPAESRLTITAHTDDKKAELESEVVTLSEDDIRYISAVLELTQFRYATAASLFTSDNQVVNFSVSNVQYDCIGIVDNLPYSWERVMIEKHDLPDAGTVHLVFSNTNARSINRRKDFRLWLGKDCTISYGSPAVSQHGTIKDIAVTGIGIIVGSKVEVSPGTRIKVEFSEIRTTSDGEEIKTVHIIFAQSVRVAALNEGSQIIGCRIIEAGRDYIQYLYKKQREALQREKGTDL